MLPAERRAKVEAVVATSPELARLLAVQVAVAVTIRAAAADIEAPARLLEQLEPARAIPLALTPTAKASKPRRGTTYG